MLIARTAYFLIGSSLVAVPGVALADLSRLWEDKESISYLDVSTLNKTPDVVTLRILKDFRQVQTGPSREKFRSAKIYYEFKCGAKLMRQSYMTRYYGPMGGAGSLSSDLRLYPWMPVASSTEKAKLLEVACN